MPRRSCTILALQTGSHASHCEDEEHETGSNSEVEEY